MQSNKHILTESQKNVQKLLTSHEQSAINSYQNFRNTTLKQISKQLSDIEVELHKELKSALKKLGSKMKSNYIETLNKNPVTFFLQPFVEKEYKSVKQAIKRLNSKINEYINQFCAQILEKNIQTTQQYSLFHISNSIKSFDNEWHSVTSRNCLSKAQIHVSGFHRPVTTWLALGVSKKKKQLGIVKNSINKEQFIGNIYLNGSDQMQGLFRLKKDLKQKDVFVIESTNRMVWVYRKNVGKNQDQVFFLDDNTEYYFYIGFKGPIMLEFHSFGNT